MPDVNTDYSWILAQGAKSPPNPVAGRRAIRDDMRPVWTSFPHEAHGDALIQATSIFFVGLQAHAALGSLWLSAYIM